MEEERLSWQQAVFEYSYCCTISETFNSPELDEPNMRVLSYQWMDSLPNPSPLSSPPLLFPHISFDM